LRAYRMVECEREVKLFMVFMTGRDMELPMRVNIGGVGPAM